MSLNLTEHSVSEIAEALYFDMVENVINDHQDRKSVLNTV